MRAPSWVPDRLVVAWFWAVRAYHRRRYGEPPDCDTEGCDSRAVSILEPVGKPMCIYHAAAPDVSPVGFVRDVEPEKDYGEY